MTTITDLKRRIRALLYVDNDPRVVAARRLVKAERANELAEAEKLIAGLRDVGIIRSRWPADTPQHVLDRCDLRWRGSTEHTTYRIHCWNDKAVWTSYPGGKWWDNGGEHYGSPWYEMISLTLDSGPHSIKPRVMIRLESDRRHRVTRKIMLDHLAKL